MKRTRRWRHFHLIALALWAGPGAVLSWLLKDSVPWVVSMSWYAIVVSHFAAWRAEESGNGG